MASGKPPKVSTSFNASSVGGGLHSSHCSSDSNCLSASFLSKGFRLICFQRCALPKFSNLPLITILQWVSCLHSCVVTNAARSASTFSIWIKVRVELRRLTRCFKSWLGGNDSSRRSASSAINNSGLDGFSASSVSR